MAESKSRLLHILKYLWQNTDAGHYTTTADILTYLKTDIPASWEDLSLIHISEPTRP